MAGLAEAPFVAGCPQCGERRAADALAPAASFVACHERETGHEVEWVWGDPRALDVRPAVDGDRVANLPAVVDALAAQFAPVGVPPALLYETCVAAGASKRAVQRQLDALPSSVTDHLRALEIA